jgi:hypothetical protein
MLNMRTLVNMVNMVPWLEEPPAFTAGRVSWPSLMATRARARAQARRRLGLTIQNNKGVGVSPATGEQLGATPHPSVDVSEYGKWTLTSVPVANLSLSPHIRNARRKLRTGNFFPRGLDRGVSSRSFDPFVSRPIP